MKIRKSIFTFTLLSLLAFVSCKNSNEPDIDVPTVVSSSPKNNATKIPTSTNVEFTFSEAMAPLTIDSTTVTLAEGTTKVASIVSYVNSKATITPTNELANNTLYTATVKKGAKSALDVSLESDFTIKFTTAAFVDNTPPIVNSTIPLSDATDVARNKTVTIVFNEPMDPASISSTTFTLMQGATSVAGTVGYADNSATYTPNESLEANTVYTAKITTGAKDLSGNGLTTDTSWKFTTSGSEGTLAVVNLGGASNYVILAKTAINNNPTSTITGHVGLSPAATSYITGFSLIDATGYATSSQVTGNIHAADMADPTPITLTTAVNDMNTAYNDAAGRPTPDFLELGTGNIGGMTLTAGLYKWTSTVTIPTDITLTGGANDVWIFQIDGDLTQSGATNVTLNGGALAKNIFWQVSGEAVFGATSHFEGNLLTKTGITFHPGASMNGRALAQTAVILDANVITKAQ